jgi:hypothetical protein
VVRLLVLGMALVSSGCAEVWGLGEVVAGMSPWGPPEPVEGNPTAGGDDPTLSSDELELYFELTGDIARVTRTSVDAAWSAPEIVAELSDPIAMDTTPKLSHDGLTMYLASQRLPTLGSFDIWTSSRVSTTTSWSAPVHASELSSVHVDTDAADALGGHVMFLSIDPVDDDADIFESTRTDVAAPWSPPMRVEDINSIGAEGGSQLSADGLTLYMSSTRAGNQDLFEAHRTSVTERFTTPQAIVEVTTAEPETDIWVSPDQTRMYFIRVVAGVNTLFTSRR